MKLFHSLFLLVVLLFCGHGAWADQPLSKILRAAGSLEDARNIALRDSRGMGNGPEFPSFEGTANAPHLVTFSGTWQPYGNVKKLAIHADDGCRVTVNGTVISDHWKQGIALPNMSRSFIPLTGYYSPNQTYHITVDYSNISYTGQGDIDGVTLYQYDADQKITVTIKDDNDHLEADGTSTTQVKVKVYSENNQPLSGVPVTLETSLGTLSQENLTTDASGETREVTLRAGTQGGFAEVTATTPVSSASNKVLFHHIKLSDFTQPKVLLYQPESSDADLASPKIRFSIEETPLVSRKFAATISVYALESHEPLCVKTFQLNSGAHTIPWNQLFSRTPTLQNGLNLDPGEGIYPFQVDVQAVSVENGGLDTATLNDQGIVNAVPKARDYKASQSLTIKPKSSNAWSLSYDEASGKTVLTYLFDITTSQSSPLAPSQVRVVVYGPDFEPVAAIKNTDAPVVSPDGKTFTFVTRGEVHLPSAGDYHFVVQALHANNASQGKDAGKWALEQNSSAKIPSYVVFGGNSPTLSLGGRRLGQATDYADIAQETGEFLENMQYRASWTRHRRWWQQNEKGIRTGASAVAQIAAQYKGALPSPWSFSHVQQQTMQYQAVWVAFGHGAGGRNMAFWQGGQKAGDREYVDFQDSNWEFVIPRHSRAGAILGPVANEADRWYALDQLPPLKARSATVGQANPTWPEINPPLSYLQAAFFFGCETGANSQNNTNPDLPSQAVALGAKVALGFTVMVDTNQEKLFVKDFMAALAKGQTIQEAAVNASPRIGGVNSVQIRGNGNIRLSPSAWGDGVGPDKTP